MRNNLNIAFWGFSIISVKSLEILINKNNIPKLLIVKEKDLERAKSFASKFGIKTISSSDTNLSKTLLNYKIKLSIVISFGEIISENVISIPKYGTLNVHFSLLPKYRGAAPIERCIMNGDTKTGVCVQQMKYKLDTGDILNCFSIDVKKYYTTEVLSKKLTKIGVDILLKTIKQIKRNRVNARPQLEKNASFAKKILKEDLVLDLNNSDLVLYRKYLALRSRNKLSFLHDGINIKITKASFIDNKFKVEKVIVPGKKEISHDEFKRNYKSNQIK